MNIHTPQLQPYTSKGARRHNMLYLRRRLILAEYEKPGATLKSVAEKNGITDTRVWQIVKHAKRERDYVPLYAEADTN